MAELSRIIGADKVVAALRARAAKMMKEANIAVVVGFSAPYAVRVHEDMETPHRVGQAKFLEQPSRELKPVLAKVIEDGFRRKRQLAEGMLIAGLMLQRESQMLCPVDTGVLRASAFTRVDKPL